MGVLFQKILRNNYKNFWGHEQGNDGLYLLNPYCLKTIRYSILILTVHLKFPQLGCVSPSFFERVALHGSLNIKYSKFEDTHLDKTLGTVKKPPNPSLYFVL